MSAVDLNSYLVVMIDIYLFPSVDISHFKNRKIEVFSTETLCALRSLQTTGGGMPCCGHNTLCRHLGL